MDTTNHKNWRVVKGIALAILVLALGAWGVFHWQGAGIRFSGQAFVVGDHQVIVEFGYSHGGDVLRYAVVRTWPKDATPEEKRRDDRIALTSTGWTLIRAADGRMIPVGTDGDVYFFVGHHLKTLRVRMNEHDDTIALGNSTTLDELWEHFQRFRAEHP